jgi:hypothetical protein
MINYVFNVRYAHEITLVYGFLDKMMGLESSTGKSTQNSAAKSVSDAV